MSKSISSIFSGTKGEGRQLVNELIDNNVKINPKDVVAITEDSLGKIVWLEKGHLGKNASGLKHILDTHESQFAKQGIKADEIPQYLMTAVKTGHVVDYQGKGVTIYSVYSNNYEAALSFKEDLQKAFPYAWVIIIDRLSLSISCHIGPDSLAIAIVKNTYWHIKHTILLIDRKINTI